VLPANSVGNRQLRNGAVTAAKVKAHTLLAKDFKPGQLPKGATGPQGATGASGAKVTTAAAGATGKAGPTGPTGASGLMGYKVVAAPETVQPTDATDSWQVSCPTNSNVLGGGVTSANANIEVETSTPMDNGTTWTVTVVPLTGATFGGSGPSTVTIRITCARS
jgi:hypothetical protein